MSVSLWLCGYSKLIQTVRAGFQINTTGSRAVNSRALENQKSGDIKFPLCL